MTNLQLGVKLCPEGSLRSGFHAGPHPPASSALQRRQRLAFVLGGIEEDWNEFDFRLLDEILQVVVQLVAVLRKETLAIVHHLLRERSTPRHSLTPINQSIHQSIPPKVL